MANVLTGWLAERYPEASPMAFYRDLFPQGALSTDKGTKGAYAGVLVRVLRRPGEPETAERHLILDDLETIEDTLKIVRAFGSEFDIVSPVSYAGRRPMLNRAHELFAITFDLDGIKVEDGNPIGIVDLFFQMEDLPERPPLLPRPTYVVSSGTGLHLYYLLDEPLRLWPNVCERLNKLRNAITRRCWNQYVTDLSKEPQMEGVVQGFRMVGSLAKDGEQVTRAFKTGERVSVDYMNSFVLDDSAKLTPDICKARHTLEQARELWPEWDPEWRRKAASAPDTPWRVKRALYDWWCRRVEAGEAFEGNRYWCIFVAACYAAKCPDVTYEELEAWAYRVRPVLDRLTTTETNHFTAKDVQDAIGVYGNPISVKLRRDKVAEKTQMPMPVNKRNGRKRELHLAGARAIQEVNDRYNGTNWREGNGRKPKRDLIRAYAVAHPDANHSEIARALGVSRPTVIKWLKPGWKEEMGSNAFLSRVRIKPASERAMYRLVGSPEQLVKVAGEAMALRSMGIGDIAGSSGLPEDEVRDIVCYGRGKIGSVRKVLDALWVEPATLPHPVALAKGVQRA